MKIANLLRLLEQRNPTDEIWVATAAGYCRIESVEECLQAVCAIYLGDEV